MPKYRNRIKEMITVQAGELQDNSGNWRVHPAMQRDALAGVLDQVGIAGALLAYHSERAGGALVIIDGHLRREMGGEWPVLVLDVNDAEADLLLATLDPLAALAQMDGRKLADLTSRLVADADERLRGMLADLGTEAEMARLTAEATADGGGDDDEVAAGYVEQASVLLDKWGVQDGDIWQAGEHFVICGDCRDNGVWQRLLGAAGVERVNGIFTSPPYAEQRKNQYGGVAEDKYVDWFEAVQENARAHLAGDGSLFINIKPHAARGERVLYVFDLVLAMARRWDWLFVDEMTWYKPGLPGGWRNRLRNDFEPVYMFLPGRDEPASLYCTRWTCRASTTSTRSWI